MCQCKNSAAIFKMAKIRQSSKQDANKNIKPSYSMLKTMLNPTAVFVIAQPAQCRVWWDSLEPWRFRVICGLGFPVSLLEKDERRFVCAPPLNLSFSCWKEKVYQSDTHSHSLSLSLYIYICVCVYCMLFHTIPIPLMSFIFSIRANCVFINISTKIYWFVYLFIKNNIVIII